MQPREHQTVIHVTISRRNGRMNKLQATKFYSYQLPLVVSQHVQPGKVPAKYQPICGS